MYFLSSNPDLFYFKEKLCEVGQCKYLCVYCLWAEVWVFCTELGRKPGQDSVEGQAGDNFWLNELYKLTRGSK